MPSQPKIQFEALVDWMGAAGHSFRSLAEETGIDKMTLSRLANGKLKHLNPVVIGKISKASKSKVGESEFVAFFTQMRRAA